MNEDLMEENGLNMTALGGTELMYRGLFERLPRDLLERFQFIPSRMNVELNPDKVRILWAHDFGTDPMYNALKDGGWEKYHKIVFVSNWQMQQFIQLHGIPWSRCLVMYNCIEPITPVERDPNVINLAYWSTPHRGLNILVPVFNKLCDKYKNINMHLFSSFDLYGPLWQGRDEAFKEIFEQARLNERIINQGTLDHEVLTKDWLPRMDIMAYPSIYPETFCICLAEAMSAKLLAVHPNYGALYETASSWTHMYQWEEDVNAHARLFHAALEVSIQALHTDSIQNRLKGAKMHADLFYSWDKRVPEWTALLESMKDMPTKATPRAQQYFEYHS